MPAHAVLIAGAGSDEILTTVGQQPKIERHPVQMRAGHRVDALLDRCAATRPSRFTGQ
jgi:hypothetical protein